MIKYITIAFLFVFGLNIYSQEQQLIKYKELSTVDGTHLRKEIERISSSENKHYRGVDSLISTSDLDTVCILHILKLQYDSLNNKISFSEEKGSYRIFFTNHNYLYKFSSKKKLSAVPFLYNQRNIHRLSSIAQRNFEYACFVPSLFPSENNDETQDNFIICKEKDSQNVFYIDSNFKIFASFEELIECKIGSLDNYLKTYNARKKYNNESIKKNFKAFSSVPFIDDKYSKRMRH